MKKKWEYGQLFVPNPESFGGLPKEGLDLATANVDCSNIVGDNRVFPVSCSVELVIPSNSATTPPTFLGQTFSDPGSGFFALPLSEGNFEIHVDGGTLPPGVLPPPPVQLSVPLRGAHGGRIV